jgi:hypothetical protein
MRFESALRVDDRGHLQALAVAERERQAAKGVGWGSGTIAMPGTPVQPKPGFMKGRG